MRAKKYILLPRVRRSARNPPKKIGLKRVPKEILNAMAKFRRASPKIRTNLVGGAVVDLILGRTPKDWDIEVFGVTPDQLADLASQLGHSKEVGKAFGVVKVVLPSGLDLDLSVPRTDNKTGTGHKGFTPTFDPNMTNKEAARRRDFTINSLALDLSNGLLIDPYGGLSDLKRGLLRVTDPKLFVQDPLRGLRAMQLLARKAKTVHPDTMRLIQLMRPDLRQLPKARILEEWRKLLLKAEKPSVGLQFLQDSRWIENFPELAVLESVPQHPEWHPEGDVWEHTKLATDAAATLRPYIREKYREPYMFAAMLHDVGKAVPGITVYPEDIEAGKYPPERLYTAHGHDAAGRYRARDFMESIGASKKDTRLVEELVAQHMQPYGLVSGESGKAAWGRLARRLGEGGGDLRLLGRLSQADAAGSRVPGVRTFTEDVPDWDHVPSRESFKWHEAFEKEASATKPMIQGRDLMALGYRPGPQIGDMLRLALELQDGGMERDEILATVEDTYPMKSKKNRRNPAYPAMLAHDWSKKGQPDPKGWWASEKYDGLRALWDGENFYSRNGKIFHAPQWFKDTLPNTPLDGELWGERSVAGFQKAVSAVRKKVGGKEWENITYMVFDIPTSKEPFEKVQAKLKRMDLGPYGEVAPQYKVKSKSDMLRHFDKAVRAGAEGIMLRKPGSKYSPTRSSSLLKVKPTDSSEAVVTGYQAGTGKHRGRMGAVHVYLLGDKSKVFKIGTGFSDRERESPPPIGSIVEFKFNDKTARGIPRFPAFLRIRTDMMADRPKRKAAKPARKKTMAKKYKYAAGDLVDFTHPKKGEGSGLIMSRSYESEGGYGGVSLPHYFLRSEFGMVMVPEDLIDGPVSGTYKVSDSGWEKVPAASKKRKPKRKTTPALAKKKDREGLFDPKHYWARRVKKKYKYSRGGSGQYPEKVGDWELDETHYDATFDGNAAYESESAA